MEFSLYYVTIFCSNKKPIGCLYQNFMKLFKERTTNTISVYSGNCLVLAEGYLQNFPVSFNFLSNVQLAKYGYQWLALMTLNNYRIC